MLKQILQAGYVDPELLDVLTEEQKDVVFRKMREEQVRKWSEREALFPEKNQTIQRIPKINFKIASDGNPWVWVMGEDHKDLSYEGMILKREREKEKEEEERLRKEAEELAKHETRDILLAPADKLEENPQSLVRTESVMDNSVDDVVTSKPKKMWQKAVSNRSKVLRKMSNQEQDDYEKRRADEIYENMLHSVQVKKKRVADIAVELLKQWREAEQTAKLHEENVRRRSLRLKQGKFDFSAVDQVFEKLPEAQKQALQKRLSDHVIKRDSVFTSQSKPLSETRRQIFRQSSFSDDPETRPKTMEHAIKWFIENERPKGIGMDIDGTISLWFHGSIDKSEAEKILLSKPAGMFLLRISCKVWGYTVSVRTMEKVKHYVLLATGGKYRFLGTNQPEFSTLVKLLKYYKFNPITWAGQEILLLPCEQTNEQLKTIQTLFEVEDVEDEETAM